MSNLNKDSDVTIGEIGAVIAPNPDVTFVRVFDLTYMISCSLNLGFSFSETQDRLSMTSFISNQGYKEGPLVPYYDLCLMTLCDGAIISNSSFSWWGAWLQNNNRHIISPSKYKWAGRMNNSNFSDVVANNWIEV